MKVVVLYRPKSEHGRRIEEFVEEFGRRYPDHHLEVIDVDSKEGVATAGLYDVMQYPCILVLQNDGYFTKSWTGDNIPLMEEVAYYAGQGASA